MITIIAGWVLVTFVLLLVALHAPERRRQRRQRAYMAHLRAVQQAREAEEEDRRLTYDEMARIFHRTNDRMAGLPWIGEHQEPGRT